MKGFIMMTIYALYGEGQKTGQKEGADGEHPPFIRKLNKN